MIDSKCVLNRSIKTLLLWNYLKICVWLKLRSFGWDCHVDLHVKIKIHYYFYLPKFLVKYNNSALSKISWYITCIFLYILRILDNINYEFLVKLVALAWIMRIEICAKQQDYITYKLLFVDLTILNLLLGFFHMYNFFEN